MKVYWSEPLFDRIMRCTLNGTDLESHAQSRAAVSGGEKLQAELWSSFFKLHDQSLSIIMRIDADSLLVECWFIVDHYV